MPSVLNMTACSHVSQGFPLFQSRPIREPPGDGSRMPPALAAATAWGWSYRPAATIPGTPPPSATTPRTHHRPLRHMHARPRACELHSHIVTRGAACMSSRNSDTKSEMSMMSASMTTAYSTPCSSAMSACQQNLRGAGSQRRGRSYWVGWGARPRHRQRGTALSWESCCLAHSWRSRHLPH